MHDIEVDPGPNNYTVGTQKKTNNVKNAHLNVRSLKRREHFILVKESILANKFDVFTISETWLNNTVSDLELEIPGYSLHRLDRQTKKGGGVCVYVLQSYKTEVLGEISYISSTDFHQLWIKIQVRNLKSIIICTTYRPPDTPVSCFNTDLTPSLITASLLDKTIYILGDLNCNLLNSSCPDSRALTNFCLTYNLSQMVTSPTRVTNLTETLIDVILVSNAKQVLKTEVLQSSISDHDLVYALLRLKQQRPKPTYINIRSFKHYDLNKFHTDVSQAPWSILDTFDDPEDKLYAFDSLFNDILDEHAPVKTIKIRGRANACVTDEIRELMKTRDYWKAKARKSKDPLHWSAYKNFHREVKREIRMAEREFATEQIINNKNNTNSIWKAIRICIPKKSASQRNYSKDDKTVANEFNSFFASVGDNTIKKIEVLAREANYNLGKRSFVPKNYSLPDQFTFSTVPHNQVESIVKSMASNKAPGIDKVPIRVIKDCLPAILPSITSIINATFESAIFPNMWKIAVVTPIPKEGDDEVPNNNRPISLQDVGASPPVIHWFYSYLSSRYQVVRINTTLSDRLPVASGVPQGSILGPLLFNIYVNDLPLVPEHCAPQCYVDDTKLLMSFRLQDQSSVMDKMNKDLLKIRNWCFDNQLLLNPDKTKLIIFGSRQMATKVEDFRLSLLGKELVPVKVVKDLGIILDSNLTYNEHIITTVSACMKRLGQINRVKHAFDQRTLTIIINSLVFSKLFYCSNVWSNTTERNLDKLQAVQNFACRIISGARKFDHITPILKRLQWLPVRDQLYYRQAIMCFKCMTGSAPGYLTEQFIKRSDVSKRSTRNAQALDIPLFRSASGQKTFYYQVVSLWNSLTPKLKLCQSQREFKQSLKRLLLTEFLC